MAKISARGDQEVARWESASVVLVLTKKGRLLRKVRIGGSFGSFTLVRSKATMETAEREAATGSMARK